MHGWNFVHSYWSDSLLNKNACCIIKGSQVLGETLNSENAVIEVTAHGQTLTTMAAPIRDSARTPKTGQGQGHQQKNKLLFSASNATGFTCLRIWRRLTYTSLVCSPTTISFIQNISITFLYCTYCDTKFIYFLTYGNDGKFVEW